ncbi:polyamine deacetylase HDAC10 [Boleophthalmus pectinirostris]|uniref:polyamine deacetylase HDAC10 n=1 Tax=Boleophthalmus pectinirostris TaxID=150288 RepID=UPI00242F9232|nr:polyamine deacetylase HDAC10 [Boleophthalmus pectinirostris]
MNLDTKTALIYDEEMTQYKLLWVDPACKIEVPERLTVSYEALMKTGLADRCVSVPVREAIDEDILLVHSEDYLEAVKQTPYMTLEDLQEFTLQYGDVYFHPNIYHCAKLAAGATLQLVDSVMTGKVRNGMALVRPPGHHSMCSAANGFCVFNNVSIAAKYAKQKYGIKRILIVDWDVHHGQGVQYCFEEDPSVLYFSWHRYEHQKFWPNLRESDYDTVGKAMGAGFNINVPWNKVGLENSDYLSVFIHMLLPVAYEFCPELVFVCAGFDTAIGDPEGEMCATPDVFAHLTHLLMNLANGKVCAVLEGGYNLKSLPQSVCETVQTLLGDPLPQPANLTGPCKSALESLHCVRATHRNYWSCLKHAADLPSNELSTKRVKLAEDENPVEKNEEEKEAKEIVWPDPLKRTSPSVRTAVVVPEGITCPEGCQLFCPSEDPDPNLIKQLQESLGRDTDDLTTLSTLIALMDQMEKNRIRSGLALVRDVSMTMNCIVQHAASSSCNRILIVFLGDEVVKNITEDGKTMLVHLSSNSLESEMTKYYIPVCLKKGCSDVSGLIHAVLSLLLPLGYEFDPGLVLLVQTPDCGVSENTWQQLTGLLQALAQGHTLVLMKESDQTSVAPTVSSLLGTPAPSLGPLSAPGSDDVEVLERLRLKLQRDWKLLQTTVSEIKCDDDG